MGSVSYGGSGTGGAFGGNYLYADIFDIANENYNERPLGLFPNNWTIHNNEKWILS